MPARSDNLYNDDECNETALLLIDIINDLDFPGSEKLVAKVPFLAETLSSAKDIAKKQRIPVLYVNDNFFKWRSDFHDLLEHCLKPDSKGRLLAEKLKPGSSDYFILKPMHSGFHCTPLELLLQRLKVKRIILCGIAANNCVLSTAFDGHMRGFKIAVPSDAVISEEDEDTLHVLGQMKKLFGADTRPHFEMLKDLE